MGLQQRIARVEHANKEMAHELDRMNRVSRQLLRLLEKDRKDISRYLHDHIGQSLVVILMALDNVISKAETAPDSLPGTNRLRNMIEELLADVRRLSHNFGSDLLDHFGLLPAFKDMVNKAEKLTGVHIDLYHTEVIQRLDPEKELAFYRIAQEALDNAVKYADASEIYIKLVAEEGDVTMIVEDNGRGCVAARSPTAGSDAVGVDVMRARAIYAGGDFSVDSRVGEGTQVKVTIPIDN